MAAHTSLLLVIALCVATVYSLNCYTCSLQTSNANCQTSTPCGSGVGYCQTIVGSASSGGVSATVISKTCASACTAGTYSLSGATATTSCCTTDLCNTSAGASIKSSSAAIILALGALLTILKSSVL
ncbi:lymphocyte antigen 6E-like [Anomaloglossus baeobatrachus]|uniref:lymphocyte antigen 6E-like n=1 Tax=Anomaloglossus baeobatrachus TaxID=238106 RepID=UPI003F4FCBE1